MVKSRLIPFGVLSLALVLLLVPLCRVGWQIRQNRQIAGKFQPQAESPYLLRVSMEEMDLSGYSPYFSIPVTAIAIPVENRLVLPKTISYYTAENGEKRLTAEIEKGTEVYWIPEPELNGFYTGYGLRGYPTYEKGWRYVRPFQVAGQAADPRYYYVRTSDLEAVARAAFSGPAAKARRTSRLSSAKASFLYTRFIDQIFYGQGVFCSPDLFQPVFHPLDLVWTGCAAALVLAAVFLRKRAVPLPHK